MGGTDLPQTKNKENLQDPRIEPKKGKSNNNAPHEGRNQKEKRKKQQKEK